MSRQLLSAMAVCLLFSVQVAWGAPSLQITVTVGDASHYESDPQTIPTATAYEANYGESVSVAYQILNTGDVEFDRHTLEDNFVGTVLNDFPYTLAPGSSAFILGQAVATEDIEVSATWSSRNSSTLEEASSAGSVLVSVKKPLISLAMTVGDASHFEEPQSIPSAESYAAFPGETITLGYTVVNEGTIPLSTHDLNDSVLGDVLINFPYEILPGASAFILQQATVNTATTFEGTWASQTAGGAQEATATDTVEVSILPSGIELSMTVGDASHYEEPQSVPTATSYTATSGETVTIGYTIKNVGEITLSEHTLTDTVIGDVLINFPYTLVPGASAFILAQSTVTATTVFEGNWTAASNDGLVTSSSLDSVVVTVPGSEGAVDGEGTAEGAAEGAVEGTPDGEGVSEGSAEGGPDGEGLSEGSAEGSAEGEGLSEGSVEGSVDGEGQSEGSAEGSADGEGVSEGTTEGSADGEGVVEGRPEGSAEGEGEGSAVATYENLMHAFAATDTNDDNMVDYVEILAQFPTFPYNQYQMADANNNNRLSVSELLQRYGGGILMSADTNGDFDLSLLELLRLIQLYNAGQYACAINAGASEDGFLPRPPTGNEPFCLLHSIDFNEDNTISLGELLRGIQFYNLGGYTWCPGGGTEDGFCG